MISYCIFTDTLCEFIGQVVIKIVKIHQCKRFINLFLFIIEIRNKEGYSIIGRILVQDANTSIITTTIPNKKDSSKILTRNGPKKSHYKPQSL